MLVTINQDEIAEAVQTFVQSRGIVTEGQQVKVTFTAGRGSNGMAASIEIVPQSKISTKAKPKRKPAKKEKEVESVLEETPEPEVESVLDDSPKESAEDEDVVSSFDDDADDEEEQQESLFGN